MQRKFKTKKVLSGMRTEFRPWDSWAEGDTLIYKFIGTKENKKNEHKVDWIVEVIEAFFEDKKEQKKFKPGTKLTLNTAGQFDIGMKQAEIGDLLQVQYNGSSEMEGGKHKGAKSYLMEVVAVEEDDGSEDEESEEESEEEEDDL